MTKLNEKLGLMLLFLVFGVATAFAQANIVQGQVFEVGTNEPLIGATVVVKGTTTGTDTDVDGRFRINAAEDDILIISYTGYNDIEVAVNGQNELSVGMESGITLNDVVVTGYTTERKADIIGSVSIVDTEDLLKQPQANLSAALEGRAAGVTVSSNGQPGSGATVRIRGFTSFGNSPPLYVIDGVPTQDPSKVNPQDIASIQVLKDATAASIYGARAAQGVIIVTTKQGTPGKITVSYDGYVGTELIPASTHPELLNTAQYFDYLQQTGAADNHPLFGGGTIPDFYVIGGGATGGYNAGAPEVNPALYTIQDFGNIYQIAEVSDGTNWFDAATQNGFIQSHQVSANGGTEQGTFAFGLNYFDQQGTLVETGYDRYAMRLNSSFKPTDYLRFGENLQVIYEETQGGSNRGEASGWAQAFRMVPYIPVFDINGGYGGNGIGQSGNGTNPVAQLERQSDNANIQWKIFGNVFAEVEPVENLVLRTSLGVDYNNFNGRFYTFKTYERSENTGITGYEQVGNYGSSITWTNTATYGLNFGGVHDVKLLAGTEAIRNQGNGLRVNTNTFDFEDPDFITLDTDNAALPDATTSNLFRSTLASIFGRIDYTYDNKYLFNATVRRDGSSAFGSANRYAVFPAFGVGWRVTGEDWFRDNGIFDDLKIRGGWGQMGSQLAANPLNSFTLFFSNITTTNYDISGGNSSLAQGYAAQRVGSEETQWETSETTNIGFDASMFNYKFDVSFNWFNNDTRDLLVGRVPTGIEPNVNQPAINIGQMRNRGFDFSATYRQRVNPDFDFDVTLNFTRYTNEVVDIDGNPETFFSQSASRLANVSRTQAGFPIASYYGFQLDGFFNSQAEIDALEQDGAVIGSWRYADLNNDGAITDADRTFLGNPHPDFIAGFNLGARFKQFDFNAFFVWNQGAELYNYTKYFTDLRVFVGGVSTRVLESSWTPELGNDALLPRLAPGGENGITSFTLNTSNDYYVEDASYLRAQTMQIGYNVPVEGLGNSGLSRLRLYVQAQNLFTITGYQGADPAIGLLNANGSDLSMGIDETNYPTPRSFLFGVNVSF